MSPAAASRPPSTSAWRCTAGIEQGFKITAQQLERAITPRSRLLWINSPSNPTGAVYTGDELKALGEVLRKHPRIVIASDDMYEHILLDGSKFVNILNACPDLYPRTRPAGASATAAGPRS